MIHRCQTCGTKNRIPASKLDQQARCGKCKTPISPLVTPQEITSVAEFDELINSSPLPVVVDFWAAWCGPCRMVAPELAKIAKTFAGRVVVTKVDTETLPSIALRYGIQSIPTMLVFRDGKVTQRVSGAAPARSLSAQLGLQ